MKTGEEITIILPWGLEVKFDIINWRWRWLF